MCRTRGACKLILNRVYQCTPCSARLHFWNPCAWCLQETVPGNPGERTSSSLLQCEGQGWPPGLLLQALQEQPFPSLRLWAGPIKTSTWNAQAQHEKPRVANPTLEQHQNFQKRNSKHLPISLSPSGQRRVERNEVNLSKVPTP